MRARLSMSWILAAAVALAGPSLRAADPPAPLAGAASSPYLAARLADDARALLRDPALPPQTAARQAVVLLQFAAGLDSGSVPTLKLLAGAARAAGAAAVEKDALRRVIALDKGDLVAQVQYLDLVASTSQTLEERARVYQSALDQAALDPQIRSEMAVRLARVAEERGDTEGQQRLLGQAVALNGVNVAALRGLVRLAAANPRGVRELLAALSASLNADPYQPDAWVALARLCGNANLHDRAADALTTALEQLQIQGTPPAGDLYLDLGVELALAGRRVEAFQITSALAKLPDAPLTALLVAEVLAAGDVPGSNVPTSRPAKEALAEQIERQLRAFVALPPATAPASAPADGAAAAAVPPPTAFADAAGVAFTLLPAVPPEAADWTNTYARLVSPDDAILTRLRGWQAYRAGKQGEASAALAKVADDPLAQVGLARIAIDRNNKDAAAKLLQDVWNSHPTGLLALQVVDTARRGEITLQDTRWTQELREAVKLPAAAYAAHRQPRELALLSAAVPRSTAPAGEPVTLSLRFSNPSDRPVPTGVNGAVVTMVGLSAVIQTPAAPTDSRPAPLPIGIYALEDVQRTFRIEPHAAVDAAVRLDQGRLADYAERHPDRPLTVTVTAATAPVVIGAKDLAPGLGGQPIAVGDLQLLPRAPGGAEGLARALKAVPDAGADGQVARITAAIAMVAGNDKGNGVTDTPPPPAGQAALIAAVIELANSKDVLVRAAIARSAGLSGGDAFAAARDRLSRDADPLVRTLATPRGTDRGVLEARLRAETDERAREWLTALLEEAGPATQPQ
jgi:tetratricopeptide (TPR) repeat protein